MREIHESQEQLSEEQVAAMWAGIENLAPVLHSFGQHVTRAIEQFSELITTWWWGLTPAERRRLVKHYGYTHAAAARPIKRRGYWRNHPQRRKH
jgi:hypothetical protein